MARVRAWNLMDTDDPVILKIFGWPAGMERDVPNQNGRTIADADIDRLRKVGLIDRGIGQLPHLLSDLPPAGGTI